MFLPLFFLFRRRILLKPSYNSCGGAITCTNMISHGMPDSACKKVFACKVKMKNLFSLQLQQNFLVQQCFFAVVFPFPLSDFTQTVLQQLQWCNYLYKHDCAQVFSAVFPCILHFTTKKTFFDKIYR